MNKNEYELIKNELVKMNIFCKIRYLLHNVVKFDNVVNFLIENLSNEFDVRTKPCAQACFPRQILLLNFQPG